MTRKDMKRGFKLLMSVLLAFAMVLTMPGSAILDILTGKVQAAEKYKVVCVGGSTTFMEYPNYLQRVLGDDYEVINRGENATTATYIESLDKHNIYSDWPDGIFDGKSYRVTGTYQAAMNDNPDCVILMIGGNDAKTNNWERVQEATGKTSEQKFEEDYRWLIQQFRNLPSHPDIIIATTGWAQNDGLFTIVNKYVDIVVPIQKKVAEELNLPMVDINAKTKGREDIYSDGIHYNTKGFQLLADSFAPVVRQLSNQDMCDLQVVGISTDKTYYDGEEAKFLVTIKNTGTVASPSGVKHGVPVFVDGVCVAWCDTYFGPMQPGEEKTIEMNWGPNNKDTWTVTEGTHTITAYVDDSELISESDEDNNQMEVSMTFGKKEMISEKPSDTSKVSVEINGYQISTYIEGYRTVYTVDDPENEVVEAGMIYGFSNQVPKSDMVVNSTNSMVNSYAATEKGKLDVSYGMGQASQSYAMTMTFAIHNAQYFSRTICVRAYAQLSDGTYVYSDIYAFSIYEVAAKLYNGHKMNNLDSHTYLYNNILKIVDSKYPLVEFQWTNIIVKPSDIKI